MTNGVTLLPCPFCGGEADEYEGDYGNGIYCMTCGAMVGEPIHQDYMTTKAVSIGEAIAAWNIRAKETPLRLACKRYAECVGSCPYDVHDLYEPWDESCYMRCSQSIDYAECWERYFVQQAEKEES